LNGLGTVRPQTIRPWTVRPFYLAKNYFIDPPSS